jgi:hypothetical protein
METFERVADEMLADPAVARSQMFGSPCLKIGGKVFASLHKGAFVVKLPRERVDALIAAGEGESFEPMAGRAMKEWVQIPEPAADSEDEWLAFAEEARDFVASPA